MYANDPEMAKKWAKEEAIREKLRRVIRQEIKSVNELKKMTPIQKIEKLAKANKYGEVDGMRLNGKTAKTIMKVYNHPKIKPFHRKLDGFRSDEIIDVLLNLTKVLGIKEERDYKAEYKKYGSSPKAKKYRAELNQYNRKKGTYGNGDGKDASHKGGKIMGFEKESTNRGRAEKSRLKKETANEGSFKTTLRPQKKDINKMKVRFKTDPRRVYTLKSVETGRVGGTSYMFAAPGNRKEHFTPKTWDLANKKGWLSLESVNEGNLKYVIQYKKDKNRYLSNKSRDVKKVKDALQFKSEKDAKNQLNGLDWQFRGNYKIVKLKESVNESKELDTIEKIVKSAKNFMDVGRALKKVRIKSDFQTSMGLPRYTFKLNGKRYGILNKKNVSKPDRVVGDIAFGVMESVNEAKIAHSKGGYVEVGKWYLLNYGKWKDTVKVVSIDSKGMKVYNPNDNWRYTIPMTMIKKKKIGGYMTPIDESVNEAVKFDSIQPKDTIDYGYAQYYVAKNDGKNIHMGLVAKKKATGGMFTSDAKLSKSNFDSQIRVKFIKRVLRNGKPLKESVNEDVGVETILGGIVQSIQKAGLKPKSAKLMKSGFKVSKRDKVGFVIDVEIRGFDKKEIHKMQFEVERGMLYLILNNKPVKLGKWTMGTMVTKNLKKVALTLSGQKGSPKRIA